VSGPKALVLLGRREDALAETAALVRPNCDSLTVETHTVDLVDSSKVRRVFDDVAATYGAVDVVIHAAGVLAPVVPLVDADPATFLHGYKTTVVGSWRWRRR
jgi:NAD(P)-dependent dehydrogenase (short-subunit alcohol dehydrogenase family)